MRVAPRAVLESIDVGSGTRTQQRVLEDDYERMLASIRTVCLGVEPIGLPDGSLCFVEAGTPEGAVTGRNAVVHGEGLVVLNQPDREAVRVFVRIHIVRQL